MLAACSTTTTVDPLGTAHPPNADSCDVEIFETQAPSGPFEKIGKIESHIKKNLFFSSRAPLKDEAFRELQRQACSLGGDAVVIDDYVESAASEMKHVHVWATVLKVAK